MQIRGKRFTVLGAGKSGIASVKLLLRKRGKVFVSDLAPKKKSVDIIRQLDELNVEHEFGANTHRVLEAETIVISPGVPVDSPILVLAREKGIPIISEIELAAEFALYPIVAITGTNGKTTTTTLTGEMFKNGGWNVAVAGNIGTAFAEVVESDLGERGIFVLEISSFQLDSIRNFRPKVSAIINITPDHLDRYKNYESYIQSKFRITENQRGHDVFVFNHDDDVVRSFSDTLSIRTYGFSINKQLKLGAYLENEMVTIALGREREVLIHKDKIGIPGPHNLMNAMAASLLAKTMGVETASIRKTLESFKGVEHRIEWVRDLRGVKFYNDSKATNVDALYYALQSFREPIVLIAGGKDKGNDYAAVKDLIDKHVKTIVTVGDGAAKIKSFFGKTKPIVEAGYSMEKAVELAAGAAKKGDVVLLSPACASFDMFKNYEHRGSVFKELVNALP